MAPHKWRTTRARMTLQQVADLLGVTAMAVSRYERGVGSPSLEVIIRYEEVSKGLVRAKDWVALRRSKAAA
jgi:transcriptional regulator with XRE-family HTH domain